MKLKQVINIFGGPGCGKSTIASGLFYMMKSKFYNVEYVTEYTKHLVYEKRFNILNDDQLYIFAKQHRRILTLKDSVDYIITDGPFLLSFIYAQIYGQKIYSNEHFSNLVITTYNKYPNLNIFLKRNCKYKYVDVGRSQSLKESIEIDDEIKKYIIQTQVKGYVEVLSDKKSVKKIFSMVKEK